MPDISESDACVIGQFRTNKILPASASRLATNPIFGNSPAIVLAWKDCRLYKACVLAEVRRHPNSIRIGTARGTHLRSLGFHGS